MYLIVRFGFHIVLPGICGLFCGTAYLKDLRKVSAGWSALENFYLVNCRIHREAETN